MSVSVVKSVALLSTMLLASAQLSSVPRRLRRGTVAIMNEENAGAEFTAKHAHEGEFGRIRQLDELSMSMPVSSLSMNLAIGADESDSPTYVPTFWPTYVPTSGQSLSMQVLASDELVPTKSPSYWPTYVPTATPGATLAIETASVETTTTAPTYIFKTAEPTDAQNEMQPLSAGSEIVNTTEVAMDVTDVVLCKRDHECPDGDICHCEFFCRFCGLKPCGQCGPPSEEP